MNNTGTDMAHRVALAIAAIMAVLLLMASPAFASEGCPNEQVREESNTNPTTAEPYDLSLPECRAYEMVSPLEKQSHSAFELGQSPNIPVSPDGSAVGWASAGAYAEPENYIVGGAGPDNPYVARRSASGWATTSALPPASLIATPGAVGINPYASMFSSDLSSEVVCGLHEPVSAACVLREADGAWVSTPDYSNEVGQELTAFAQMGASANLSVDVFGPYHHLLPADQSIAGCELEARCALYSVSGSGTDSPDLSLVDVDNSGKMIGLESPTGLGAAPKIAGGTSYQAVSSTGASIFFTATPNASNGFGSSTGVQTLFARLDGSSTVDVSNPSPSECTRTESEPGGQCNAPAAALYQGASADGSKVFFVTSQQLVNADTDQTPDLYEYDFSKPVGQNIVQVSGGGAGDLTPGSGAEVAGVVAISEDGSHVYFVAKGVLTTLPNGRGATAVAGAENLYAYDTDTEETKFVATLSARDDVLYGALAAGLGQGAGEEERLAQTTPDGSYLVFDSVARPIAVGPEADTSGARQVYRYDFQTGEVSRISISHDEFGNNGNTPDVNALIGMKPLKEVNGGDGAMPTINDVNRAISDSGADIVFVTAEKLQSGSTGSGATESCRGNFLAGCQVYEWHECAHGICSDGEQGEVTRISDGEEPSYANFAVISGSGSDIFFQASTQLVAQDTDNLGDIYDARIDGGFPAPTPEPSCTGEACQGAQTPAPTFETPGSQSFTGGGNQTAPPFKEVLEPETKPKSKPLTRAQKLAKALRSCKKDRSKAKRQACKQQAMKKYSPAVKKKR